MRLINIIIQYEINRANLNKFVLGPSNYQKNCRVFLAIFVTYKLCNIDRCIDI